MNTHTKRVGRVGVYNHGEDKGLKSTINFQMFFDIIYNCLAYAALDGNNFLPYTSH